MRIKPALILVAAAVAAVALTGCGDKAAEQPAAPAAEQPAAQQPAASDPAPQATDPAALFNEKCSRCHAIEKATSEDLDKAGWLAVIDQMIAKGAQIRPDEADAIATYLAENYGPK